MADPAATTLAAERPAEQPESGAHSVAASDPIDEKANAEATHDRSDDDIEEARSAHDGLDGGPTQKTNTATTASSMEPVYPHGLKLVAITIGLMFTILCVALDNTIIATAIPRITDDFNSLGDVGWYASAYFLTNCTFQLLFGRIYTFFPLKTVYLIGLGIFELGSLVCGAAPNSVALIIGRAIAGLGAGSLFSGSLIIVSASVPLQKRPMYVGVVASMFGIASVVGPLMGGAFTDRVTWRMCFYINLPLGLVTAVIIAFLFKSPPRHQQQAVGFWSRLRQFDPFGNIIFIPGIICLLLALQWGGTTYAWNNARVIALFVLFGVLIIGFIAIQCVSGENATVPVRIVKSSRTIPFTMLWSICIGGSFFSFVYYLPIWFQAIHGVSATQSGIDTLPLLLSQVLGAITGGIFVSQVGYYTPILFISVIFSSVGAGLLTTFTPATPIAHWIGFQIIYGLGTGFGFQQAVTIVQCILPNRDIPVGTSLVLFVQILGGSIFVSAAQNLFENKLLTDMAAVLPPELLPAVSKAGATGFYKVIPPNLLPQALDAYNGAIVKVFQLGLILSCLTIIGAVGIEVKNVKTVKQKKKRAIEQEEAAPEAEAEAKQPEGEHPETA